MAYNLIVTDEMDKLLENCVNYILRKFKNEQAASHLLDEVEKIYDEIEDNPGIYPVSDDPFFSAVRATISPNNSLSLCKYII